MLELLKRKPNPPKNPWRKVHKMWDQGDFDPDNIEYPDNTRIVEWYVNNGNVGHTMTGFYYDGQWYHSDYLPARGLIFKPTSTGVTVVGWRELDKS